MGGLWADTAGWGIGMGDLSECTPHSRSEASLDEFGIDEHPRLRALGGLMERCCGERQRATVNASVDFTILYCETLVACAFRLLRLSPTLEKKQSAKRGLSFSL